MPHFLIIFYLELFPSTGVCVVGWVWLWPYHFKGACSGPDIQWSKWLSGLYLRGVK